MAAAVKPMQGLSMTELRGKLQGHLKQSGALGNLKTQLRTRILSEVISGGVVTEKRAAPRRSFADACADALIAHHLQVTGRQFTLSVFNSEAGVAEGFTDERELAAILSLQPRESTGNSILSTVIDIYQKSVSSSLRPDRFSAVSTQTAAPHEEEASLETKLALIDAQYALRYKSQSEMTLSDYEVRLKAYRHEVELELREEMKRQIKVFREKELSEMRGQEEKKYQLIVRHKQEEFAEMERTIQHRLELERSRLDQLRQDLEVRSNDLSRRAKDAMNMVAERDETVTTLENQVKDMKERLSRMHAEVVRYEDLAAQRLEDMENGRNREQRRIDDIRRLQAEHMIEMRLRDEEISDLRFRLRGLPAGTAGLQERMKMSELHGNSPSVSQSLERMPRTSSELITKSNYNNSVRSVDATLPPAGLSKSTSAATPGIVTPTATASVAPAPVVAPSSVVGPLVLPLPQPVAVPASITKGSEGLFTPRNNTSANNNSGRGPMSPTQNTNASDMSNSLRSPSNLQQAASHILATFNSPTTDRPGEQTHLSQLSSIAAQSVHPHATGGAASHSTASETPHSSPSSTPRRDLHAVSAAETKQKELEEESKRLIELLVANAVDELQLLSAAEGADWKKLLELQVQQVVSIQLADALRELTLPLLALESSARQGICDDEGNEFKDRLWDAKRSRDDAIAKENVRINAMYGGGASNFGAHEAPLKRDSSDDDDSDILFKKGSDSDDDSI